MKTYFADTNFYLRFILKDNESQSNKVKQYLKEARDKKIKIVFLSSIILEMEYVLRSVYTEERDEISKYLEGLIETSYLDIKERDIWKKTFWIYRKNNINLIDIYLHFLAEKEGAGVLSFDKDFRKLEKFKMN